jgi:hypothetical protein
MKRRQLKLGSAVVVSLGLVVGGVVHVATADTNASAETPPETGSVALSTEEVQAATPADAGGTMRPATEAGQPKQTAMAAEQSPAASASATLAKTGKLKVKGVYQSTNYWCVPASSEVSLGTFGVNVSQRTLAKKMKTTTSGTYDKTALPVINSYVNPLGYSVWDANTTDSATNLLNWAAHDIGILKRAPKIGVWMEKLPWNKGLSGHFGHAILIYGYDLNKKTLTVWDPWKPSGGSHTLSAATTRRRASRCGSKSS